MHLAAISIQINREKKEKKIAREDKWKNKQEMEQRIMTVKICSRLYVSAFNMNFQTENGPVHGKYFRHFSLIFRGRQYIRTEF